MQNLLNGARAVAISVAFDWHLRHKSLSALGSDISIGDLTVRHRDSHPMAWTRTFLSSAGLSALCTWTPAAKLFFSIVPFQAV